MPKYFSLIPFAMSEYLVLFLFAMTLLLAGCVEPQVNDQIRNEQFTLELSELQAYFDIPGMAVLVKRGDETLYENYFGYADRENGIPVDSLTTFPVASLTKIFSATLIMQLVEQGHLSLDEPINRYVTYVDIPDSITVEHVLTHTSQGDSGKHFFYSGALFTRLTPVIATGFGAGFEEAMKRQIIDPLGMSHTYILEDSAQAASENEKIARPYFYRDLQEGIYEYGASASAGIVTTVRDLAIFSRALDENRLISGVSADKMMTPYSNGVPYGYGQFVQEFEGRKLVWGYGQYDFFSSLLLKVPDEDLTLIITANNNFMSDPPRLLYGDVTYSLFAVSFLKNFLFEATEIPIFKETSTPGVVQDRIIAENQEIIRQKLLGQAIAEGFLAQADPARAETSRLILEQVFEGFPQIESYTNLSLMHAVYMPKSLAEQFGEPNVTQFDHQIEQIGELLLSENPDNPYALYYMADFYRLNGDTTAALEHYRRIAGLQNFDRFWYTTEAEEQIRLLTE